MVVKKNKKKMPGGILRQNKTATHLWVGALFLYLSSWVILSWPWISQTVTIPYDAKALFQTQIQFLANALHSGQSPFWNPHAFSGSPQIADPQSLIFSPAFFLALLNQSPSFFMIDMYVLCLLGLGGIAIILLFKEMDWHPAGGVLAAIAFSFGASASSRIQHIGQITSLAFFIMSLWLAMRLVRRMDILSGFFLGFAISAMVVAPDQPALLGCYILFFVTTYELVRKKRTINELKRLFLAFTCCGVVVFIIAVGPLLLVWLFVEQTTRPHISWSEASEGSLHPASLLTALIADLFGAQNAKVTYWGPYSPAWFPNSWALSENMGQVYIGCLPFLVLVYRGLVRGSLWNSEIRSISISFSFMLLYALGHFTPVFEYFYLYLPGINGFRRPADATFMFGALGAVIAGYLLHLEFKERDEQKIQPRWALGLTAFSISAVMIAVLIFSYNFHRWNDALPQVILSTGWFLISAAVFISALRIKRIKTLLGCSIIAALITADLAINNGPSEATGLPPKFYRVLRPDSGNETVRIVKEVLRKSDGSALRSRVEIVGVGFEWPNVGMIYGFDTTLGYNPLRLSDYSKATGARDTVAGPDQRVFAPLFPSYKSPLANMLGLRVIVSGVPIEQIDHTLESVDLKLIAKTKDAWIYENPESLPRVLFVRQWQIADFDKLLETGQWPLFDPTKTVLLEEAPSRKISIGDDTKVKPQSVRIVKYENTKVIIEVVSDHSGLVVLNDVWHPWWSAKVNGKATEILKANVLFRAVEVPPGRNIITFDFDPVSGAIAELSERFLEPL